MMIKKGYRFITFFVLVAIVFFAANIAWADNPHGKNSVTLITNEYTNVIRSQSDV